MWEPRRRVRECGGVGAWTLRVAEWLPALSTRVIDRIGAGDAFLALAGLCLGGKLAPEIAAFAGSVAAALDVQIVCNREPVDPGGVYKYIATLLK